MKAKNAEKELIGYLLDLKDEKPTEYLRILKAAADEEGTYRTRRASQALPLLDEAIALTEKLYPDGERLLNLLWDRMRWLTGRTKIRQCKEICALFQRKPFLRSKTDYIVMSCIDQFVEAKCWTLARNEFIRCLPMFRKNSPELHIDWVWIRNMVKVLRSKLDDVLLAEFDALVEANLPESQPQPARVEPPKYEVKAPDTQAQKQAAAIVSMWELVKKYPIEIAETLRVSISNGEHGWDGGGEKKIREGLKTCVLIGEGFGGKETASRSLVQLAVSLDDDAEFDSIWQKAIIASECSDGFYPPAVRCWYADKLLKRDRTDDAVKMLLEALDAQANDPYAGGSDSPISWSAIPLLRKASPGFAMMPADWDLLDKLPGEPCLDKWAAEWKAFRAHKIAEAS
jgi:hypothetical protein